MATVAAAGAAAGAAGSSGFACSTALVPGASRRTSGSCRSTARSTGTGPGCRSCSKASVKLSASVVVRASGVRQRCHQPWLRTLSERSASAVRAAARTRWSSAADGSAVENSRYSRETCGSRGESWSSSLIANPAANVLACRARSASGSSSFRVRSLWRQRFLRASGHPPRQAERLRVARGAGRPARG